MNEFVEVNVKESTAIARMVYNARNKDLFVQYTSAEKVYIYKNVERSFVDSFENASSIGKAVAEIKKKHKVEYTAGFPRFNNSNGRVKTNSNTNTNTNNTIAKSNKSRQRQLPTNKRNNGRDYSSEWLKLLSQKGLSEGDYIQMLESLDTTSESLLCSPPEVPPPRVTPSDEPGLTSFMQNIAPIPRGANPNPFYVPGEDTDDDDNDDNDIKEIVVHSNNASRGSSAESIQVRYLLLRIRCGRAEAIRGCAIEAAKEKQWQDSASLWDDAYKVIQNAVIYTDGWRSAMLETNVRERNHLLRGHNEEQLKHTMDVLDIVLHDTEREKVEALKRMENRLRNIQRKLDPLLQDRDMAKGRIGEYKWTHNEAPQMTYAERRADMERELKELENAIPILMNLAFHRSVPSTLQFA